MWINLTDAQWDLVSLALRERGKVPDLAAQELGALIAEQVANRLDPENAKWISAAEERYLSCGPTDGDIDIDSDAVVSDSDEGAYVMLWGWIRNEDVGLPGSDDEDDPDYDDNGNLKPGVDHT
jgi:hypothetical protein